MDRRGNHRPVLNRFVRRAALSLVAAGWFVAPDLVCAQQPASTASPTPSVAAPPDPGLRRRMTERRQHELADGEQEAQRRIDALPPEEREAFKRNLRLWRQLDPEERETVRKEAADRTREEIDRAYQQSGLRLDKDGREVFALRYRQERRKLERELQEKAAAERTRRLPGLVDGLKKEFADKPAAPSPFPRPAASDPVPSPVGKPTPSVSVPAAPVQAGR